MDLPIPRMLGSSARDDVDGDLRTWVEEIGTIVPPIVERWGLTVGAPYEPGGQCSWVAPAVDPDGRDVALKVGWRHAESQHEAAGLRAWAGCGAIEVYDTWSDERTCALLLERCSPGTTLKRGLPQPAQDVVMAGLLRRLWTAPTDGPFRTLDEMCRAWADEADGRGLPAGADAAKWADARALYRALPSSAPTQALLATDLHEENVLAAEREPWLVIDLKPHIGDPHYDVLQHILNHDERVAIDPLGTVDRMAALCGLDRDRSRLWLVARCSVEPGWPLAVDLIERLVPILL